MPNLYCFIKFEIIRIVQGMGIYVTVLLNMGTTQAHTRIQHFSCAKILNTATMIYYQYR